MQINEHGWYVTFISIIFGVFISVWVEPMVKQPIFGDNSLSLESILMLTRGILMFAILICLWWWYAIFLGKVEPADGFLMFSYDFSSLAAFAIAFRMWDIPKLFSVTVFIGAFAMFIRLIFAKRHVHKDSKEQKALKVAVGTLKGFMIYFFGAFSVLNLLDAQSVKLSILGVTTTIPMLVNIGVMGVLVTGIAATISAVTKSEGLKWGNPEELERKD